MEHVVRQKTEKEQQEGMVLGPFGALSLPNSCMSPLGIILKNTPRKCCLIHYLSYLCRVSK